MPSMKPLPDCEGPKLEPFTQDITAHDVEFLQIPCYNCEHAVIAKVKIDGQVYCLKMFLDIQQHPVRGFFTNDGAPDPPQALEKVLCDHNETFHCECRAFGRLKQLGREDLAVRVYGYISLPLTKDILKKMYRAMEREPRWKTWSPADRDDVTADPRSMFGDKRGPDDGSWCIMGILKDWVGLVDKVAIFSPDDEGPDLLRQSSMFGSMLTNLKALHECGIVVCDVHSDQWVDGILVDLSCAMTIPHVYGPGGALERPGWTFTSMAAWDLRCFQTNVIDYWNKTDWSWYPDVTPPKNKSKLRAYGVQEDLKVRLDKESKRMRERLRPRLMQHGPFLPLLNNEYLTLDLLELPPYDPAKFDWRQLEADGVKTRESKPKMPKTSPSGRRGERSKRGRVDAEKRHKSGQKMLTKPGLLGRRWQRMDRQRLDRKKRRESGPKIPITINPSGRRDNKMDKRRADAKSRVR